MNSFLHLTMKAEMVTSSSNTEYVVKGARTDDALQGCLLSRRRKNLAAPYFEVSKGLSGPSAPL